MELPIHRWPARLRRNDELPAICHVCDRQDVAHVRRVYRSLRKGGMNGTIARNTILTLGLVLVRLPEKRGAA